MIESKGKKDETFELVIPEMFLPYGTRSQALITNPVDHNEEEFESAVNQFLDHLGEAVRRRVNSIPNPHSLPPGSTCRGAESRLAVMFSGGIDSMLVAALATKHFPAGEPIELVVYFLFHWHLTF